MNFRYYPADTQSCSIPIRSCKLFYFNIQSHRNTSNGITNLRHIPEDEYELLMVQNGCGIKEFRSVEFRASH